MELSHSFLHNAHRLNSSIEVQVLQNISFPLQFLDVFGTKTGLAEDILRHPPSLKIVVSHW